MSNSILRAHANDPQFNGDLAREEAMSWLDPLMTFALWAIPLGGAVRILLAGLTWLQKDEQEREQNPFHRTFITYLKWLIALEMIPTVFKIFGLMS